MTTEITPAIARDLLVLYESGEASEETNRLVERLLDDDPALRDALGLVVQPQNGEIGEAISDAAEWAVLRRTQTTVRKRQMWLAAAAASTSALASGLIPEKGFLSPDSVGAPAAWLAYGGVLAAWAGYLNACRLLAGTGIEPPAGRRGYWLRLSWGSVGLILGFLGGEILGPIPWVRPSAVWLGFLGAAIAVGLGERWRRIPRPEEIEPPVSIAPRSAARR